MVVLSISVAVEDMGRLNGEAVQISKWTSSTESQPSGDLSDDYNVIAGTPQANVTFVVSSLATTAEKQFESRRDQPPAWRPAGRVSPSWKLHTDERLSSAALSAGRQRPCDDGSPAVADILPLTSQAANHRHHLWHESTAAGGSIASEGAEASLSGWRYEQAVNMRLRQRGDVNLTWLPYVSASGLRI